MCEGGCGYLLGVDRVYITLLQISGMEVISCCFEAYWVDIAVVKGVCVFA